MKQSVLMIATLEGMENCANVLSQQLEMTVEVAANQRSGTEALRSQPWTVVVVEESLVENDPAWADQVWQLAGLAVPIEVNFAVSGSARLSREIKAALKRRTGERIVARRAVALEFEEDFRSSLTGLLLESELVLQEPVIPASLEPKLRHVLELAGAMRQRLATPRRVV